MGQIKRIVYALLLTLISGVIVAQNNTNSPYTRYGYGQLVDQGFGRSQAMGGVGFALRDNSQINPLNPAAYTAMDSLTFLFEGGISFQNTNFNDQGKKLNTKNSSLEYIALQFRLKKWMSMSAGVLPISNIGYSVNQMDRDGDMPETHHIITKSGDGGLHKFYTGIAFKPFKGLSVGLNAGFFWGKLNRNVVTYFPNLQESSGPKATTRMNSVSLKGFNIDFGAQYKYAISKKQSITVGAVYTPKLKLSNDITVTNFQTSLDIDKSKSSYDMAASYGFGAAYELNHKLMVSADIFYQQWSKAKYHGETEKMSDLARLNIGAEYTPNYFSRKYIANIKYRLGAHITNPYYKIDGQRASREFGVSGGFGLPLPKSKSQLNVSAQFIRVNGRSSAFLNESIIRLNLGLIFNERWFFKPKI